MLATIKSYGSFNKRRYSDPWVAKVTSEGKLHFDRVGGYTGGYRTGDPGDLYISDPVEGQVYAYGQRDYRGGNTSRAYVVYRNGQFEPVDTHNLVQALNASASN